MTVICAWCDKVLADGGGPLSHGICESCAVNVERTFLRTMFPPRRARPTRRSAAGLTLPLPGFAPA